MYLILNSLCCTVDIKWLRTKVNGSNTEKNGWLITWKNECNPSSLTQLSLSNRLMFLMAESLICLNRKYMVIWLEYPCLTLIKKQAPGSWKEVRKLSWKLNGQFMGFRVQIPQPNFRFSSKFLNTYLKSNQGYQKILWFFAHLN